MNRTPEYRIGVGAASILMIFVVLCLTTLGVLSFASARADLTLTRRRGEQVEAYYAATAQAQALLSQIDAALCAARDLDMAGKQAALSGVDARIHATGEDAAGFLLPVKDAQALRVELTLLPGADGPRYALSVHELTNTTDWQPEDTVTLATPGQVSFPE